MNFGFLIFPGMEELDLVGPWEKISLWSKFTQGPEKCFMVAENPDPVICERDMVLHWIFSWYRVAKAHAERWIIRRGSRMA